MKDASAEALFPHQPQFQPAPRLPLGAAATEEFDVVNTDMQVSRWQLATIDDHARHSQSQARFYQVLQLTLWQSS